MLLIQLPTLGAHYANKFVLDLERFNFKDHILFFKLGLPVNKLFDYELNLKLALFWD